MKQERGKFCFFFFCLFFLPSGQHLERLCHSKGHKCRNQGQISNCVVLRLHHLCCIGRCDCTCYVCCRSSCCHHLSLRFVAAALKSELFPNPQNPLLPGNLPAMKTPAYIGPIHTETMSVSSVCVRLADTLPWRIVDCRLNVRATTRARMDRSLEFCSDGEREKKITALRRRFPTSSGFLSHKDLSKRNCCVKWKFLKVKRLLRKRENCCVKEIL